MNKELPPKSVLRLYYAVGPEALGGLLGCVNTHISATSKRWLFGDGSSGPYSRELVIKILESIGFSLPWEGEDNLSWDCGLIMIPPKEP